ncbi:MAG: F0F1 ATP synthase subunit epsilon [Prevotellaceae bacterium]|jgi:F-type H+-transporting ATPase subunit epsilon|nr:F0F1 ATP synthase subunit epsilon [Prevotellaceae bacterium]
MKLIMITPQECNTINNVDMVTVPGSEGSFTVLRGHASLVSSLHKGVVLYDGQQIAINGGVVEVHNDTITIIT